MRPPRFRLTIGGLMALVLASGLATWNWVLPWLDTPTPAERSARAGYERARLNREVSEYALAEYDAGLFKQSHETARGEVAPAEADLARAADRLRSSGQLDGRDPRLRDALDRAIGEQERQAMIRNFAATRRDSIQLDIARARAVEVVRYAAYRAERAKRWWSPGLTKQAGD